MFHINRIFNELKDNVTGQPVTSASTVEAERAPASNIDSANPKSVVLHIYSISDRVNRFSLTIGLGLYHTAVEVYGREHSFVGHPFPFSGIVSTIPKSAAYVYQEGLPMGQTKMTEEEVGHCLKELGKIFLGSSYHLLQRNCNHFASEFVKRLCNGKPPAYINRAANSACCLPFLDHVFSAKTDAERSFVEVLYLALNGDMNSVLDVLDVDRQTTLSRYVSYIEASFDDHSIPKCLPYDPVLKASNPFAPSKEIVDLVKKNLCANFIFNQTQDAYDLAFDLYENIKSKGLQSKTLANYTAMRMSEFLLDSHTTSSADYSTNIHYNLSQLHQRLVETITRPISEHSLDNRVMRHDF